MYPWEKINPTENFRKKIFCHPHLTYLGINTKHPKKL
jgi:hypothetical protein